MKFAELKSYTESIKQCPLYDLENPKCSRIKKFRPVINTLTPSQEYMIISSDPSGDTDKEQTADKPHSDFALRFLALIFTGSDSETSVEQVSKNFSDFQDIFSRYFYWTHYNKCYAAGNPNKHCANIYLKREIELFEPSLIISLGGKPVDLLLGNEKLLNRVNKVLYYGNVPVIASLHPSRDWNLNRRPEFSFNETWDLIRKTIQYSQVDTQSISQLLEQ